MAAPGADLPRATLASLPTPLHHLPRFSAAVGAEVWMKRDDIGPLGLPGNKVRKLRVVLRAARRDGADALVIVGAEQSNACRAAAAACAQLGMRCVLVLSDDEPDRATGNLLLDRLYGAEVRFAGTTDWAALAEAADRATAELRSAGASPATSPVRAPSPPRAGAGPPPPPAGRGRLRRRLVRAARAARRARRRRRHRRARLLVGRHPRG